MIELTIATTIGAAAFTAVASGVKLGMGDCVTVAVAVSVWPDTTAMAATAKRARVVRILQELMVTKFRCQI